MGNVSSRKRRWVSGRIYDPNNGKTYRCIIRLAQDKRGTGPDRLILRGYIGVSLFGRTTEWVRVPKDKERAYTEEGG